VQRSDRSQRALSMFGDDGQGHRRAAYGDRSVHSRVVPIEANHRGDQPDQAGPGLVGDVVVDSPGNSRQKGMGAAGVITPPLPGKERGEFHETSSLAGRPMFPA